MIKPGPFKTGDKVAAWCFAAVLTICGAIGLGLAVAKAHWRLGISAVGVIGIGCLWALAARRGRPVEWPVRRRTTKPR